MRAGESRLARRSHIKSKDGCATCKRRRVRCDELRPQCQNCIKRGCRCDFINSSWPPQSAKFLTLPDALTLGLRNTIDKWREDGQSPFPDVAPSYHPSVHHLSSTDLRLMYHLCQIVNDIKQNDGHKLAFATSELPIFMKLAFYHDFLAHACMGLAASHIALVTKSAKMNELGCYHRVIAFKGLQPVIKEFSQSTSDAVLAASIILSWQTPESTEYTALMQGVDSVLSAMDTWKHESILPNHLETPTMPETEDLTCSEVVKAGRPYDLIAFEPVSCSLEQVRAQLYDQPELLRVIQELINFVHNIRLAPPGPATVDQFRALFPLRSWLPWMPTSFLKMGLNDPMVLIVLAHFHAVNLAIGPLLPAVSKAFFVDHRANTILCIDERLRTRESCESAGLDMTTMDNLMRVPRAYAYTHNMRKSAASLQPQILARPTEIGFI